MPGSKFFAEREDQSEIKAQIVTEYFIVWAKIMIATQKRFGRGDRVGYVDLFAGPGRYKDGSSSTPLMVLEHAIADTDLPSRLVSLFNDKKKEWADTLTNEIGNLPGVSKLKHTPKVLSNDIADDFEEMFSNINLIPTFSFVDPFGYKGISLGIINSVIKDWGCDCVFFFNYNRINAGISNVMVKKHMNVLFGEKKADELRTMVKGKKPEQREAHILEAITEALKEMGGHYVLPFRFRNETGKRTSHFLIFVSKHIRGYEVMKEIMARKSSTEDQGVASFMYSPADESTPLLFSLNRPLESLKEDLFKTFAGRTLLMRQVYEMHHVDTPFLKRNYKSALNILEDEGRIIATPAAPDRRIRQGERTFADSVSVTFNE